MLMRLVTLDKNKSRENILCNVLYDDPDEGHKSKHCGLTIKLFFMLQVLLEFWPHGGKWVRKNAQLKAVCGVAMAQRGTCLHLNCITSSLLQLSVASPYLNPLNSGNGCLVLR